MDPRLEWRSSGEGPPLIIQPPAWGPSSDYLRLTLAPLLEGFRVITFDARNTGGSERVVDGNAQAVDHLVSDLEGLRTELDLSTFTLVGHSHGGYVAMAYAIRHPTRLRRLLLLNTRVREDDADQEAEAVLREMEAEPKRARAVRLFRETRGRLADVDSDADLARRMRALMPAYFVDLGAMRRFALAARSAQPPSAAALARVPEKLESWVEQGLNAIDVPTLVVTGRRDVATPPSASRRIHRRLPAGELVVFEHSGHHPWAEEPELFRAVVGAFLAGKPSATGWGDDSVEKGPGSI